MIPAVGLISVFMSGLSTATVLLDIRDNDVNESTWVRGFQSALSLASGVMCILCS